MTWYPEGYADQATAFYGEVTNDLAPGTPVSGQVINVTRTQASSTATAAWTLTSDANGDFSLADVPATPGRYPYTFTIMAPMPAAATAPVSASIMVTVQRVTAVSIGTMPAASPTARR